MGWIERGPTAREGRAQEPWEVRKGQEGETPWGKGVWEHMGCA